MDTDFHLGKLTSPTNMYAGGHCIQCICMYAFYTNMYAFKPNILYILYILYMFCFDKEKQDAPLGKLINEHHHDQ